MGKTDLEKQKVEESKIMKKARVEVEVRNFEDKRKKIEASKLEKARKQDVKQRKLQDLKVKWIGLALETEVMK